MSELAPIRVVVVDDSFLMREFVRRGIGAVDDIEVVATCADCLEARTVIRNLNPDVVTLDVEMPDMNGIEFLKKIMELRPMPVVMVSTFTSNGTETTLSALEIGAVEVVEKPTGPVAMEKFIAKLIGIIRNCRKIRMNSVKRTIDVPHSNMQDEKRHEFGCSSARLIAVGASTGGVSALQVLLRGIPRNAPPIVIAQHMPSLFVYRFARRLADSLARPVSVAQSNHELISGHVYISPADAHLEVVTSKGQLFSRLLETGPVSGHIPSVDVLFGSVANAVGPKAVGVILTGMGKDGALGMRSMKNSGSLCLGQSEKSCVVYGMPRAAFEIGAVHEELDLSEIPDRVCQFLKDCSYINSQRSIGAN